MQLNVDRPTCLLTTSTNPFINIATETWIFKHVAPNFPLLFLWQNEPCVIIGRHQNPWVECALDELKNKNVHLVRRYSGGGAVYQDLGNLNFTFLNSIDNHDVKTNFALLLQALRRLNIEARVSGRNDVLVGDAKISGSAFKKTKDRAFHHGTLLLDANLNRLNLFLTPDSTKLTSKGIKSVKSRVCNLNQIVGDLTLQQILVSLQQSFFDHYGVSQNIVTLEENDVLQIPKIKEIHDELVDNAWRFGESPEFSFHRGKRFSWGGIDLHLDIVKGKIVAVKVFSDCLDTDFVDLLEGELMDISYNADSIREKLQKIVEASSRRDWFSDVSNWLVSELQ